VFGSAKALEGGDMGLKPETFRWGRGHQALDLGQGMFAKPNEQGQDLVIRNLADERSGSFFAFGSFVRFFMDDFRPGGNGGLAGW